MKSFFDGLERSDAFAFIIDEAGDLLPVKNPGYRLYQGSVYPFVMFADELESLNDYCYTVVHSIDKEILNIHQGIEEQRRDPHDYEDYFGFGPTFEEMMTGLDNERYKWEWLCDMSAAHLVILLYSFLEKTLKYIYNWFMEEGLITLQYKCKRPTLNFWLYNILGLDDEAFKKSEPAIDSVLTAARKMRNNFAHDNLEGADLGHEDYVYVNRKYDPAFKLIELIDAISAILYKAEKVMEP